MRALFRNSTLPLCPHSSGARPNNEAIGSHCTSTQPPSCHFPLTFLSAQAYLAELTARKEWRAVELSRQQSAQQQQQQLVVAPEEVDSRSGHG